VGCQPLSRRCLFLSSSPVLAPSPRRRAQHGHQDDIAPDTPDLRAKAAIDADPQCTSLGSSTVVSRGTYPFKWQVAERERHRLLCDVHQLFVFFCSAHVFLRSKPAISE